MAEVRALAKLRGHPIHETDGRWFFTDTGEATELHWKDRPCGHCGLPNTPEGHDGCLGTLPGVMNACCGHGRDGEAFVQFSPGVFIRGEAALEIFESMSPQEDPRE